MLNKIRAIGGLLLIVGALAIPAQVLAATYTVTRGDDPPPNACQASDCSLREAIMAANSVPGSTVNVPLGTYTLTIPGADNAITNAGIGDIDILAAMTIVGAGNTSTIIQAGTAVGLGIHRIFDVHSTNAVTISGVTIRYGNDTENSSGGCIRNGGTLTLDAVLVTGCGSNTGGAGIASYHTLTVRDSVVTANTVHRLAGNPNPVSGGGISGGPRSNGQAGTVTIIRTRITNNVASSYDNVDQTAFGGGFANTSIMNIRDSTISGNTSISTGGGINGAPASSVTIERTTIDGNRARYDTGGIDNDGIMVVSDSTFSNNAAGYLCTGTGQQCERSFAGGLLNATGTLDVFNSTFTGNTCHISGGGILTSKGATTRISSTTVVGNTCDLGAGVTASGTTYLENSIVAGNDSSAAGGDCSGNVTSRGYNIVGDTTGCVFGGVATGNHVGVDPKVGPLDWNGGPTKTMPLLATSPAINGGDPGGCTAPAGDALASDQRGYMRHFNGDCDIGAFERVSAGTSVVLWSADNVAMAWQLNGSTFASQAGFGGPGTGWRAESYTRVADASYYVLWSADNLASLWHLNANGTFAGSNGFGGFGPGWSATSVWFNGDGSYQLLWTADARARVVTINANGTWGGYFGVGGPAGWRATSYTRAADGSHRILWSGDNLAMVWTLTPTGGWGGQQGLSGPGAGWTATSYNLNGDGSFNVIWTRPSTPNALAVIWTINADGSFNNQVGLGGPAAWSAQSFFK